MVTVRRTRCPRLYTRNRRTLSKSMTVAATGLHCPPRCRIKRAMRHAWIALGWSLVALLTAPSAACQAVSGLPNGFGRGQGAGGLFGVTRRTYMGAPNAIAARYFHVSGVPVANAQTLNAAAAAGGYFARTGGLAYPAEAAGAPRRAVAARPPVLGPTRPSLPPGWAGSTAARPPASRAGAPPSLAARSDRAGNGGKTAPPGALGPTPRP
jgi:hypothetical protein